jgi:hypothetical protein
MEIRNYRKKIFKPSFSIMLLIFCLLSSITTIAEEYRLDVLATLPALNPENNIAIIPLPIKSKDKHQYLLADETGVLSLLIGTKLLPLTHLPLSDQLNSNQIRLTALTLHPSFLLADKTGYQTFFTAHIEPVKTNNNVARLTLLENPTILPFDAVITQWQYNNTSPNKIDLKQRREVIRIAVPTATHQIQKIAFNPYNKTWHDDYGLMYVALSESKNEGSSANKEALYSGVVLRITPEKFGLRNYMVPNSNPFVKANDINKEIFILGAENIKSFSWLKQHHDSLVVQHIYNGVHQVAVANKGTDWRDTYQNQLVFPLKTNKKSNAHIFPYYGRDLKTLVGSVLYLSNNTKNWQFAKLNISSQNNENKTQSVGQTIALFDSKKLPPKSKVTLLFDHDGELLLLNHTKKQLLSITANLLVTDSNDQVKDQPPNTLNNDNYGKLLLAIFILVLSIVFYRLRPKNKNVKSKLRSQYARFELDDTETTLSFYNRHQSEIDSTLAVTEIVKSEVFLNNKNINIINKNNDHGFNKQRENQIRLDFTQAHRHKLIDEEIRQVNLHLTDKSTKTHVICLYLRKGNQRLTKEKYLDALENIIDWNWFIANKLNPEATENREIKVPVVHAPIKKSRSKVPKKAKKNEDADQNPEIVATNTIEQTKEELHNIAMNDSELINALDKLVNLKQQGFLTDEEFSLAKAKILSDMTTHK